MVEEESLWHKIHEDTPIEFAATVSVNPVSALRMLNEFVTLKPGRLIFFCLLIKHRSLCV